MRRFFLNIAVLGFLVPIGFSTIWVFAQGWPANWHQADWSATGIAPDPGTERRAVVQVYSARTGRWKGIFATHSWILIKPAGAARYTRFDVVGWGPPVRTNAFPADGRWYDNTPWILSDIRGAAAAAMIPPIRRAVDRYPYRRSGDYGLWPGPNSNTFIAWVSRQVPGLAPNLPSTALGKDYSPRWFDVMPMPSNTGWQVSMKGLIGVGLARAEGFELHFLGATLGVDFDDLALNMPAIGRVGLADLATALSAAAQAMGSLGRSGEPGRLPVAGDGA